MNRIPLKGAVARRWRLAASLGVGALVMTTMAAGADSPARTSDEGAAVTARYQHIDPSTISSSGWKPAAFDASRKVTAIVKVSGKSVGQEQVEAKKQGKELSRADKAQLRAEIKDKQDGVKDALAARGAAVLDEYQDAYNGIAVRVALKDLPALANVAGVDAVYPSRSFKLDNTAGAKFIGAPEAWGFDTGLTGDGIKVAVLDTGVDYLHANFGGPGTEEAFDANDSTVIEPGTFPTAKVVGGWDFVGDDYDADGEGEALIPHEDPDPLDCNGHGSHVAGSSAGFGVLDDGTTYDGSYDADTHEDNTFRIGPGIAPAAQILAYRVFGCAGSTGEETIVAAIDRAMADGADVINMSLGSPFGRIDEPSAVASDVASQAGVVVVASSGNEGPNGYMTGAPAVATRSISVAAIDASGATFPGANIDLGGGVSIPAMNANGAAFADGTSLVVKVLRNADGTVSLGCDKQQYVDQGVSGKLVVVARGTCARVARAVHGQQAGAAAVVMVNNSSGLPPFEGKITGDPDTGEEYEVTIPFLGVKGVLGPEATDDGDALVAKDGLSVTLTNAEIDNTGYKNLASFSSGGPRNLDSAAKPDVTAPGVSVVSTGVGTGNEPATISGTSMASPMTAGVAALVTEAHPTWSTEDIKAAILNTADASGSSWAAAPDVRLAGTGVVQPRKAVDSTVLAVTGDGASSLSFGYEALSGPYTETKQLTFKNTGLNSVTYDLSSSVGGVSFSSPSVTVPAGGTASVDVTLSIADPAALPTMSTSVVGWGGVVTVRGVVIATPTTDGPGLYPLRVSVMSVPRGLSNVTAGAKTPYDKKNRKQKGNLESSSILTNSGVHAGTADVYAWGISDPDDVTGAEDGMDIRNVGVQVLAGEVLEGTADDRSLVFAVNVHGKWSNGSTNEFDIAIDSDKDDDVDFYVVGVDFGAVTADSFNGQFASIVFDAEFNIVNSWAAESPMNGSTVLLPTLASDIGLKTNAKGAGKDGIAYQAVGLSIVPEGLTDTTASASFDPHRPAVSSGDFLELAPGASAPLRLTVDKGRFKKAPALGWLVVSIDDANGAAQADEIPVGPLP